MTGNFKPLQDTERKGDDLRGRLTPIHIILFILTFLSTLIAGAMQKGVDPITEPGRIILGLPFSITLIIILLSHELSHYFASRKHHTPATLPYFIPAPSLIGTFGAFIKMSPPIMDRKALLDIGISGPLAGFIVSVVASLIGLSMSEVVLAGKQTGGLGLGNSLLFMALTKITLGIDLNRYDVVLHPIAFAGWIGLFVTSLNLLPIGQLDGGHISYAMFGKRHRWISIGMIPVLLILGTIGWFGWSFWALLMLILGLGHPPTVYDYPLDRKRRILGWLGYVIFIITFSPVPFSGL